MHALFNLINVEHIGVCVVLDLGFSSKKRPGETRSKCAGLLQTLHGSLFAAYSYQNEKKVVVVVFSQRYT